MLKNNIYLLGFMGSGKTTTAKKLAKELNFHYCDLDLEIEKRLQQKIEDIFSNNGEHYFRLQEQHQLHQSASLKQTVISVGGGTPCFFNNMEWMLANGTCIYIDMPAKALFNRLKNAKRPRPLIDKLNEQELQEFITNKLHEREVFYKQAHHHIAGINFNVETLAKVLLQA